MADGRKRAFVCGHPVAHSRSPLIHGYWLKTLGLAGDYVAVDVAPAVFETFILGLEAEGYVGGNVTIPHKEAAFVLTDVVDEAGEIIGAINTVWLEDASPPISMPVHPNGALAARRLCSARAEARARSSMR